jgi:hypothetical protein
MSALIWKWSREVSIQSNVDNQSNSLLYTFYGEL